MIKAVIDASRSFRGCISSEEYTDFYQRVYTGLYAKNHRFDIDSLVFERTKIKYFIPEVEARKKFDGIIDCLPSIFTSTEELNVLESAPKTVVLGPTDQITSTTELYKMLKDMVDLAQMLITSLRDDFRNISIDCYVGDIIGKGHIIIESHRDINLSDDEIIGSVFEKVRQNESMWNNIYTDIKVLRQDANDTIAIDLYLDSTNAEDDEITSIQQVFILFVTEVADSFYTDQSEFFENSQVNISTELMHVNHPISAIPEDFIENHTKKIDQDIIIKQGRTANSIHVGYEYEEKKDD